MLFESRDGGATFTLNRALYEHPSRPRWQPGAGGLCLHSIVPWPGEPDRLAVAISAAGVWLTEDGGASWSRGNEGLVANYMPEDVPADQVALCVHRLERAPARPERIFMQFHGGVYRSDDAGASVDEHRRRPARPTSASRSPSTPPTRTAPTSSRSPPTSTG